MLTLVVGKVYSIANYKLAYVLNASTFPISKEITVIAKDKGGETIASTLEKMYPESSIKFISGNLEQIFLSFPKTNNDFVFLESGSKEKGSFEKLKREIRFKNGRIFSYIFI